MTSSPLLNVDEAIEQILATIPNTSSETGFTTASLGRVLAKDIISPESLPAFRTSAMDGYAVFSEDLNNVPKTLPVVMDIPAGIAPPRTLKRGEIARIMTGSHVPTGADAVVPVEDTDSEWALEETEQTGNVRFFKTPHSGANIRDIGENIRTGDRVIARDTVLRPQDIGMLAALGISQVDIFKQPKVVILGTGDELVDIDDPLEPGKIRDVNGYAVTGMTTQLGANAIRLPPAKDTLEAVRTLFREAINHKPDMIISTAGVSVGAYDVVRTVLDEFGEIGFWRVNVRPGKPLAFGQIQGVPFFGLPGNPVSALVTFDVFVRPALVKLTGKPDDASLRMAITDELMQSDGRRTYVRVKLRQQDGQFYATTTGTQSSGALMSMVLADGLMIIPEGIKTVEKGTELPVRLLRNTFS